MRDSIAVRESARVFVFFSKSAASGLYKALAIGLLVLLSAFTTSAWAASTTVVISQYYVNGGSANAAYTNKYVELFNISNAPVSLNGWSLQYGPATSTSWASKFNLPNATLKPGQHYLVQLASNGASGASLPTPDAATTSLNPAAAGGKIALINSTTSLAAANCPPSDGTVIDFIGYGTANCSEPIATPATANNAPALSVALSGFRAGSGCTDTDNNAVDFSTAAANPRNSAMAATPCGGSSNPVVASRSANPSSAPAGSNVLLSVTVTPGANPTSSGLTVSVDLSSIGGASNFALLDDGAHGDGASGDNVFANTTTLGNAVAPAGYSLPVTVTDAQSRTAAAANISLTVILPPEPHSIMEIQGHGARSSFAGSGSTLGTTYVSTPSAGHQNVVTAVGPKGFFMQDTVGDNDPTTSDGIYVYLGTAPSVVVGDLVSVTGRIQEFSGSTEIAGGPSYSVVGHDDNSVPAPYDLTTHLPSTDSSTGICTGAGSTIVAPSADGLTRNDGYQAANFACLDGMLVTMSHGIVNAPTYTTANSGITPSPATPNSGFYAVAGGTRSFRKPGILGSDTNRTATIPTFWGNPELVQVYFGGLGVAPGSFPAAPNMPTGGIYNGGQEMSLTGVIQGYQAATAPDPTYELYPRSGADITLLGSPTYPVAVSDPIAGKLTVGTQNMLHFFNNTADGADTSQYNDTCAGTGSDDTCPTAAQYATRLKKMSLQLRTVLKAPVVQVVQEAENYSVLTDLANQIHGDDASITYHPYLIPGNDPGGINIGILVREGVTVNSVTQINANSTTSACSISGSTCLLNDRPPVLLDGVYQGYHFRILAIYDRSLSNLGVKDYVGQKRREQAEQVAAIVQSLQTTGGSVSGNAQQNSAGTVTNGTFPLAGDASVPVVILGDFNAYEFSDGYVDVTGTIMGTVDADATHSVYPPTISYVRPNPVLFDTGSTVAQALHYSYNFQGLLQEIDHILLTSAGQNDFVSVEGGRGNSDISIASLTLTQNNTPQRTSDHDGQVVTLGYVVTPSAGPHGTITPSTVLTVAKNSRPTFAIQPDPGYVAQVGGTCGGGLDGPYYVNEVVADCTVVVTFAPEAVDGSCGSDDGQTLLATPTNLCSGGTASAVTGSGHPWSWTCNGSNGGANATCSATIHTWTVSTSAGSGGSISPNQTIDNGASAIVTITPTSGYAIANVTGCGGTLSGTSYTIASVTADCAVTATFSAQPVNGACGSDNNQVLLATPTNLCSAGTPGAISGSGHPWNWSCNGANGGSNTACSATIRTWTVSTSAGSGGSISPSQTVDNGTGAVVTVTPTSGYSIASVSGCGGTLAGTSYTIASVTANCTVAATFSTNPVDGVCGSDNGKTLSVAPTNLCSAGTSTAVVGSGPWTWSCQGTAGGKTASCSANAATGSLAVLGGGAPIVNGDTSPNAQKGTDFGNVNVGSQTSHGFTLSNSSGTQPTGAKPSISADALQALPNAAGDLVISSITSSNPAFTISGGVGTVPKGGSASFTVTFNATTGGVQNATIRIVSNDPAAPTFSFAVIANAVPVSPPGATVSAPALDPKTLLLLIVTLATIGYLALRRRGSLK